MKYVDINKGETMASTTWKPEPIDDFEKRMIIDDFRKLIHGIYIQDLLFFPTVVILLIIIAIKI